MTMDYEEDTGESEFGQEFSQSRSPSQSLTDSSSSDSGPSMQQEDFHGTDYDFPDENSLKQPTIRNSSSNRVKPQSLQSNVESVKSPATGEPVDPNDCVRVQLWNARNQYSNLYQQILQFAHRMQIQWFLDNMYFQQVKDYADTLEVMWGYYMAFYNNFVDLGRQYDGLLKTYQDYIDIQCQVNFQLDWVLDKIKWCYEQYCRLKDEYQRIVQAQQQQQAQQAQQNYSQQAQPQQDQQVQPQQPQAPPRNPDRRMGEASSNGYASSGRK